MLDSRRCNTDVNTQSIVEEAALVVCDWLGASRAERLSEAMVGEKSADTDTAGGEKVELEVFKRFALRKILKFCK